MAAAMGALARGAADVSRADESVASSCHKNRLTLCNQAMNRG